jgi:predicted kinase
MRKWMRERITRRKKSPEDDKAQPAQAPLQPAYFDGEASAPVSKQPQQPDIENTQANESHPGDAHESSSSQKGRGRGLLPDEDVAGEIQTHELGNSDELSGAGQPRRPNVSPRPARRRRGRGGRGRSGPRSVSPRVPIASPSEGAPGAGVSEIGESGAKPAQIASAIGSPSTPRVPKGVVVLAIGLPGSGKSSWFKRHNIAPLSSDLLRALLFDDPTEQRFQDLVFSNLRSMLKARLIARRPMNYVDATNLTSHDRRGWIKLAQDYGYEVQAVFFDVPLEVCLERNRKRERVVSEDVMRRMASKQKPPTFEEGFAKITVVRVKQKE